MASAFARKGSAPEQVSNGGIDTLRSKIGQLVVEGIF